MFEDPWARAAELIGQYLGQASAGVGEYLSQQQADAKKSAEEKDLLDIQGAQAVQKYLGETLFPLVQQNYFGLSPNDPSRFYTEQLLGSITNLISSPILSADDARNILSQYGSLEGTMLRPDQRTVVGSTPGVPAPATAAATGMGVDDFGAMMNQMAGVPAPVGLPIPGITAEVIGTEQVSPFMQAIGTADVIGRRQADVAAAQANAAAVQAARADLLKRYDDLDDANFAGLREAGLGPVLESIISSPVTAVSNAALEQLVNYGQSVSAEAPKPLGADAQASLARWMVEQVTPRVSQADASTLRGITSALGSGQATPEQIGQGLSIITGLAATPEAPEPALTFQDLNRRTLDNYDSFINSDAYKALDPRQQSELGAAYNNYTETRDGQTLLKLTTTLNRLLLSTNPLADVDYSALRSRVDALTASPSFSMATLQDRDPAFASALQVFTDPNANMTDLADAAEVVADGLLRASDIFRFNPSATATGVLASSFFGDTVAANSNMQTLAQANPELAGEVASIVASIQNGEVVDEVIQAENEETLLEALALLGVEDPRDTLGSLQSTVITDIDALIRTGNLNPLVRNQLLDYKSTVLNYMTGVPDVGYDDWLEAVRYVDQVLGQTADVTANADRARQFVTDIRSGWTEDTLPVDKRFQVAAAAERGLFDFLPQSELDALLLEADFESTGLQREEALRAYDLAGRVYESGEFGLIAGDTPARNALAERLGVDPRTIDEDPTAFTEALAYRYSEIEAARELQRKIDIGNLGTLMTGNFADAVNNLVDTYSVESLKALRDVVPTDRAQLVQWQYFTDNGLWDAAITRATALEVAEAYDNPMFKEVMSQVSTLMRDLSDATPSERAGIVASIETLLDDSSIPETARATFRESVLDLERGYNAGAEARATEAVIASRLANALADAGFPSLDEDFYQAVNRGVVQEMDGAYRALSIGGCIRQENVLTGTLTASDIRLGEGECGNLFNHYEGLRETLATNNQQILQLGRLNTLFGRDMVDGQVIAAVPMEYKDGRAFEPEVVQQVLNFAMTKLPAPDGLGESYPNSAMVRAFAEMLASGDVRLVQDGDTGVTSLVAREGPNQPYVPFDPFGGAADPTPENAATSVVPGGAQSADLMMGAAQGSGGGGRVSPPGDWGVLSLAVASESGAAGALAVNMTEGAYGTIQLSTADGWGRSGMSGFLAYVMNEDARTGASYLSSLGTSIGLEPLSANASNEERMAYAEAVHGILSPGVDGTVPQDVANGWANFVQANPNYGRLERAYAYNEYVMPAVRWFAEDGRNVPDTAISDGLTQVLADARINHGPGSNRVFARAVESLGLTNADLADWLAESDNNQRVLARRIVEERFRMNESGGLVYFTRAKPAEVRGLLRRKDDTLAMLRNLDFSAAPGPGGERPVEQPLFPDVMPQADMNLVFDQENNPPPAPPRPELSQPDMNLVFDQENAPPPRPLSRGDMVRDLEAVRAVERRIESARQPGTVSGALPQWPTRQEAYMMAEIFDRYGIDFDPRADRQTRRWYQAYQELSDMLEASPITPAAGTAFDAENNPPERPGAARTTNEMLFDETGSVPGPAPDMTRVLDAKRLGDVDMFLDSLPVPQSRVTFRNDYEIAQRLAEKFRQDPTVRVNPKDVYTLYWISKRYGIEADPRSDEWFEEFFKLTDSIFARVARGL